MAAHAHSLPTQFQLIETSLPLLHNDPRPVESKARPYIVPDPPERPSGQSEEVRQLRSSLEAAIASRITSGSELIRALAKERREQILPTTIPHADALLGGGLSRGKMTEIAGRAGRFSIVQATLAAATSIGEAAALIDLGDHFDPQLGAAAGIDLRRLLWIRPHTLKQAVMAAEMLGAAGFQLVVIDAGIRIGPRIPGAQTGVSVPHQFSEYEEPREIVRSEAVKPFVRRRVPDAAWVRLARTAENHGCTILVSAPFALTGTTSEAMLSSLGGQARWVGRGRAPRLLEGSEIRLRLEKHRRLKPGHTASIVLHCLDSVRGQRASLRTDGGAQTLLSVPASAKKRS